MTLDEQVFGVKLLCAGLNCTCPKMSQAELTADDSDEHVLDEVLASRLMYSDTRSVVQL